MNLQTKFNITLSIFFFLGLLIAGIISYTSERSQAEKEVAKNANLILAVGLATRSYTVDEVRPLLSMIKDTDTFFPQSVPSYAAHQTINRFNEEFPGYIYREVVLNPTNPRDRASDWEVSIIREFQNDPDLERIIGHRSANDEDIFYLARPIQIKDPACLECHSTLDAAPKNMIDQYGTNGFGWKLDDIVGIQIVSVPLSLAAQQARNSVLTLLISFLSVFILIYITINFMLRRWVLTPLNKVSRVAEQMSLGHANVDNLSVTGQGEIGVLQRAVKRMGQSLEKSMEMLKKQSET